MTADLQNPVFTDDDKAREALEAVRWPNGPVCAHCGAVDGIARVEGKSHRSGLLYCNHCKTTFTVTVGTVFERSKIGLAKWWLAVHLLSSSKKGMSAHQLHRMLGITYKSAWFMAHRIREAMSEGYVRKAGPIGGTGKTVEADETFLGPNPQKDTRVQRKKRDAGERGSAHMMAVYSLVERGGNVRSFPIRNVKTTTVMGIMQVSAETKIMTDDGAQYRQVRRVFTAHGTVNHSAKEYVYGDAHTNTVENYFSILKRGIYGTYQHVSEKHLRRYCDELDFRHNNRAGPGVPDTKRAEIVMAGAEGKRLTYRRAGLGTR